MISLTQDGYKSNSLRCGQRTGYLASGASQLTLPLQNTDPGSAAHRLVQKRQRDQFEK